MFMFVRGRVAVSRQYLRVGQSYSLRFICATGFGILSGFRVYDVGDRKRQPGQRFRV